MQNSGWVLITMALMLGIRHGFDWDHLATIDSMARTVSNKPNLSKITGLLFSLGHGLVVISVSLIIGSGMFSSHIPQWLDALGNYVSISFLFFFGFLNLWNVLRPPTQSVFPSSIKNFVAKKIIANQSNPLIIIIIGILFAFSFDTFSQVALFSLSASLVAGWLFSGILGVFFMLGMMFSDGLNGWFISLFIQRANRTSLFISRLMGLMIASFSLIIGIINLTK